ncbi:hypothetical protein BV25DRAFT_1831452 [Artomyces pyxidatus]|uniref:Uncharacterized protein n=1 Tax=Artomyces pyxidatus TaxID=48021 RepID=A0ACB8SLT7_9AGAM|nr:hypothetical protein BV25DRAFT_1831452 [Artomyces pyxidatus]
MGCSCPTRFIDHNQSPDTWLADTPTSAKLTLALATSCRPSPLRQPIPPTIMPPFSSTTANALPPLGSTLVRSSWMTQDLTQDNKEQKIKTVIFTFSAIGAVVLGFTVYGISRWLWKKYMAWKAGRRTEEADVEGRVAHVEDATVAPPSGSRAGNEEECGGLLAPEHDPVRNGSAESIYGEKGYECSSVDLSDSAKNSTSTLVS